MYLIDTHCHMNDPQNKVQLAIKRHQAQQLGVAHCVVVAAELTDLTNIAQTALAEQDSYSVGIHPLFIEGLPLNWLQLLDDYLSNNISNNSLVAVGEIGLDYFISRLLTEPLMSFQQQIFVEQLLLAKRYKLPLILHSRHSVEKVLQLIKKHRYYYGGIAHAFNGSLQQAKQFIDLGFKIGFGGAMTYQRANKLQGLAKSLPIEAIVIETDSPDMPPQWLYVNQLQRKQGKKQPINTPCELPKIAEFLAKLRKVHIDDLSQQLWLNSCQALNLNLSMPK